MIRELPYQLKMNNVRNQIYSTKCFFEGNDSFNGNVAIIPFV